MTIDRAIEWQKEFKVEYDGILKEVDEAIDMAISALQEQKNHVDKVVERLKYE